MPISSFILSSDTRDEENPPWRMLGRLSFYNEKLLGILKE